MAPIEQPIVQPQDEADSIDNLGSNVQVAKLDYGAPIEHLAQQAEVAKLDYGAVYMAAK